ncbi:MAG: DUF4430 domain-containing protein [Candidatus Omnitrophota bacterium]|nr:MAG: DUF4430 domain-containing protein [Candidatus Omnitrophota bacterium]
MNKIIGFITAIILCVSSSAMLKSWAANQTSKNITMEINYGDVQPSRTVEIPWIEGRTVLEMLQTVAEVETHPVGEYVMVTSIDGIKGKRGEMAWYYKVNGKSADKIAYSKIANGSEHIQWVYKEDVCSLKVDSKNMAKKGN